MSYLVIKVLSSLVTNWRGTAQYKNMVEMLASEIKSLIPDQQLEPQIAAMLEDIAVELKKPSV